MSQILLVVSFLIFTTDALACSYCKKAAPAGGVATPSSTTSTVSGGSAPVRVIAAKPAIDMNAPIILGDYSAGPEQMGLRKGNTEEFEVPTSEIFGN